MKNYKFIIIVFLVMLISFVGSLGVALAYFSNSNKQHRELLGNLMEKNAVLNKNYEKALATVKNTKNKQKCVKEDNTSIRISEERRADTHKEAIGFYDDLVKELRDSITTDDKDAKYFLSNMSFAVNKVKDYNAFSGVRSVVNGVKQDKDVDKEFFQIYVTMNIRFQDNNVANSTYLRLGDQGMKVSLNARSSAYGDCYAN